MEPTGETDLGSWIDYRAKQLGMDWSEIAELVGVPPQTLWNWRTGKHLPRRKPARALEQALQWRTGSIDGISRGLPPIPIEASTDSHATELGSKPDVSKSTRAELNLVADWIALWRGESLAEEFLDWAWSTRAEVKLNDTPESPSKPAS